MKNSLKESLAALQQIAATSHNLNDKIKENSDKKIWEWNMILLYYRSLFSKIGLGIRLSHLIDTITDNVITKILFARLQIR